MKHVLVPMLLALIVRVAFLASSWSSPFFLEPLVDAKEFHDEAVAIASGEGLPARPYDRPPLFSYTVALVYAIAGADMRNVFPLHALLGVLTVGLTAHVTARLFGVRTAWIAGIALALARLPIVMEGQLLGETLQTFLLVAGLAFFVEAIHRKDARAGRWWMRPEVLIVAGGVAGALAVVTRPASALVVVPSLILAGRFARRPGAAIAGGLAVVLAVGVVTARNRIVGGEWVAVSYNGGINFFIGNAASHDALMDVRPGLEWERLARTPRALGTVGAFRVDPWREGFAAWDRRYYAAAFEDIADDPAGWIVRLGKKALRVVSRVEIERNLPLDAFTRGFPLAAVTLPFAALAPFALAGLALAGWGLARGAEDVPRGAWLVIVTLSGVAATCVIFFVTARYRVPAYPAMAILSGWVLSGIVSRPKALVAPLLAVLAALVVLGDPGGARHVAPAREKHLEAIALERLGRPREALDAHRAAIEEMPGDPDVVAGPMALLISAGRPEAAIPLGERAAALVPDHPSPLFNLGLAYQQAGRHDEAVRTFERLTVVAPGDARAFFQLGRSRTLAGAPEAALRVLVRASELAPEMPLPWLERARALGRLGREEEARTALAIARRVDPGAARAIAADPELAALAR